MNILNFVLIHKLQPADAIELALPEIGFPKHYAVYLGMNNGSPKFIANTTDGVNIVSNKKMQEFVNKYEVTAVEQFEGSPLMRKDAIKRALSRINEKAYNLIFNNCEHFKNWVLHGFPHSTQVRNIGIAAIAGGFGFVFLGDAVEKKGFVKAGIYFLLVIAILWIAARLLYRSEQQENSNLPNF